MDSSLGKRSPLSVIVGLVLCIEPPNPVVSVDALRSPRRENAIVETSKLGLIDALTRLWLPVLRMCPYLPSKKTQYRPTLKMMQGLRCTSKSFSVCVAELRPHTVG